ncbi:hypothetical protein EYZ11_011920 [Aspergillus tanneri]|uniref:Uncharacterized protein n=1 Tax=Aspergillus tanneri TaxID=1220188 RepID=A0A4S3J1I9_9EURO|nr:hypothetical protein EYZ11_011920 [Aspergillus tanneri]
MAFHLMRRFSFDDGVCMPISVRMEKCYFKKFVGCSVWLNVSPPEWDGSGRAVDDGSVGGYM